MTASNCQMTREELEALVRSEKAEAREKAVARVFALLTSADHETPLPRLSIVQRRSNEGPFCSCLNYGSLAGSFTEPLVRIVMRVVEFWAVPAEGQGSDDREGRSRWPS